MINEVSNEATSLEKATLETVLNDEAFVGIHFLNGEFSIKFPLGYHLDEYNQNTNERLLELEKRKDILLLINVLSHYKNEYISHKETDQKLDKKDNLFPIYAYMFVYKFYKKYGYYIPKLNIYKKSTSGKINWNRTIKSQKPIITNGNIVYLDTIRNKTFYDEKELITLINKYCVYQSYLKIGCLFSLKLVKKQQLPISNKSCIRFLKKKIQTTFNNDEINLFKNMIKILEQESNDSDNNEYYFGTTSFHTVFEAMINDYYGENRKIREEYNPKLRWYDKNGQRISKQSSTLRPDTIAFSPKNVNIPEKVFILDSKYYKGSVNLDDGNLPLSESVPKQIVYSNWAINKKNNEGKNVFNAFIMPDDLTNNNDAIYEKGIKVLYYGYVRPEWLSDEEFLDKNKPYNRIQGIKIDTKTLMKNYARRNINDYNALLSLIEKEADNLNKCNT